MKIAFSFEKLRFIKADYFFNGYVIFMVEIAGNEGPDKKKKSVCSLVQDKVYWLKIF